MKLFFEEFKKFISRGSVLDMAVGVVVGGAFTSIVTSLVNDIFMPLVAFLTANVNFSELKLHIKEDVTINYGNFIQNVVNFLIVAFCVFVMVKYINKAKDKIDHLKKKEEEQIKENNVDENLETLKEIRDLLKEKN